MTPTMKSLGIDQLSVADRIAMLEETWDSISATPEQLPLTEAQKQEIDRRLAAHEADPTDVVPWDVVKGEALARMKR
jgi:putative addiction module component (TIGR02574 family)